MLGGRITSMDLTAGTVHQHNSLELPGRTGGDRPMPAESGDDPHDLQRARFQNWREGFESQLRSLQDFCDGDSSNNFSITNGKNASKNSSNENPGSSSATTGTPASSNTNPSIPAPTQEGSQDARLNNSSRSASTSRGSITVDRTNGPLTTLEEMIILFDQLGSVRVLFESETSIWTQGEEDLKEYMRRKIEFVLGKFQAATPEIKSSFTTYANIQISAAIALNSSRIAKINALQQVLDTRFQNLDGDFGYDWLSKSWAEVEAMYAKNDSCIQSLIKAFGDDWEAFYEKKKQEKTEPLFSIAQLLAEYKDKLNNSLNKDFCCEKDKLETYYKQAFELIKPSVIELNNSGRMQLNEKIDGIIATVKNKVEKKNDNRNKLDAQISIRAVQYAVSRFCEAVDRKVNNLVVPCKMSESSLKNWQRKLIDHVTQCFFNVPLFVYTKHWTEAWIQLTATLEREEEQFERFHSTNQLCHEMRIETAIFSSVVIFRRQVMQLLSNAEKTEFLTETNKALVKISDDLKKQFPATSPDYLLHLFCQKLQTVGEELKIEDMFRQTRGLSRSNTSEQAHSSNNETSKDLFVVKSASGDADSEDTRATYVVQMIAENFETANNASPSVNNIEHLLTNFPDVVIPRIPFNFTVPRGSPITRRAVGRPRGSRAASSSARGSTGEPRTQESVSNGRGPPTASAPSAPGPATTSGAPTPASTPSTSSAAGIAVAISTSPTAITNTAGPSSVARPSTKRVSSTPPASVINIDMKPRRSQTKLKFPSSFGFGIFFTETTVHVSVTVYKNVQHFTLSSLLRLDLNEPVLLPDPDSQDSSRPQEENAINVYDFVTNPEITQTKEIFKWSEEIPEALWAEEVISMFFSKVKTEIRNRWASKDITEDVIAIGLPTFVSSECRKRLKTGLSLAGLQKSVFVHPTTAIGIACLSSPLFETGEHHCLVSYRTLRTPLEVALLKITEGNVSNLAIWGVPWGAQESMDLEPALHTVATAAKIQTKDVKYCISVRDDETSDFQLEAIDDIKFKDAVHSYFPDVIKTVKLSIAESILGGLAAISEDIATSDGPCEMYAEAFPYQVDLLRIQGGASKVHTLVEKYARCGTYAVEIHFRSMSMEEIVITRFSYYDNHTKKVVMVRTSAALQRKYPNAFAKLTICAEGMISAVVATPSAFVPEEYWEVPSQPMGLPDDQLGMVTLRCSEFDKDCHLRQCGRPLAKKAKYTPINQIQIEQFPTPRSSSVCVIELN